VCGADGPPIDAATRRQFAETFSWNVLQRICERTSSRRRRANGLDSSSVPDPGEPMTRVVGEWEVELRELLLADGQNVAGFRDVTFVINALLLRSPHCWADVQTSRKGRALRSSWPAAHAICLRACPAVASSG
jgi:hypothetical protein